jgi:putative ABC transport system permease protein
MNTKQKILIGLGLAALVHAVAGYWVLGFWVESPGFRGFLTVLSFPVVVAVGAALVATVFAVLPVPKVPLSYNLRNLQVRWKTTLITALAFTLVVALLTVMLAFVKAMDRMTEGSAQPGNVMVLSEGATDEVMSNLSGEFTPTLFESKLTDLIEKNSRGEFLFVQEVYMILNHMLPNAVPGGRQRRFVQVRGLDNALRAAQIHDIELEKGQWWSEGGKREINANKETANEVVIGYGLAQVFGADKGQGPVGPGEILEISGQKWYVIGVMKPTSSSFGSEIWCDFRIRDRFGRIDTYNTYVFRTKNLDAAQKASQLVKDYRGGRGLAGYTEVEYYAKLGATNAQFLVTFIFVAIIMAIGGVLGVMNTMFAAISQRAKDIGVMRLLGYSRWQILMSFLMESVLISLAGGLLGLAIGYLADGYTASSIISGGQGQGGKSVVLQLVIDFPILCIGLVFSLIMGAVGGFLPSLSAMRLKPLESLR